MPLRKKNRSRWYNGTTPDRSAYYFVGRSAAMLTLPCDEKTFLGNLRSTINTKKQTINKTKTTCNKNQNMKVNMQLMSFYSKGFYKKKLRMTTTSLTTTAPDILIRN